MNQLTSAQSDSTASASATVTNQIENRYDLARELLDLRQRLDDLDVENYAWRKAIADEVEEELDALRADLKDRSVPDGEVRKRWSAFGALLKDFFGTARDANAALEAYERISEMIG